MFMYRFVYINVCQCMLMHVDVGRSYMEHTGCSGLQRVAAGCARAFRTLPHSWCPKTCASAAVRVAVRVSAVLLHQVPQPNHL